MLPGESVYSITLNAVEKYHFSHSISSSIANGEVLPCWMIPYSWLYPGVSQRRNGTVTLVQWEPGQGIPAPSSVCSMRNGNAEGRDIGCFGSKKTCLKFWIDFSRDSLQHFRRSSRSSENVEMLSDMSWVLCLTPTLFSYLWIPITPELWQSQQNPWERPVPNGSDLRWHWKYFCGVCVTLAGILLDLHLRINSQKAEAGKSWWTINQPLLTGKPSAVLMWQAEWIPWQFYLEVLFLPQSSAECNSLVITT